MHWGTAAGAVSGHIDNHFGIGIRDWAARSSSTALWFDSIRCDSIFTATFHVAHTEQTKKVRGAVAERERRREERDEDVDVDVDENVGKLRVGFRLALRLATECRAWCARSSH